MRSRPPRTRPPALLLVAVTVLGGMAGDPTGGMTAALAAERGRADAGAEDDAPRPEHRQRKLPDDVFKPSEEVGEDYPVPFPVDI